MSRKPMAAKAGKSRNKSAKPAAKNRKPQNAREQRIPQAGRADASLPSNRAGRGVTASAHIQAALRREIMALQRKPGEAIIERDIATHYGVSRTPVREAILRLADEGLIEIFPQSGTFVAPIPLNNFQEAVVIRKALEETTSRLAAERATASQIKSIAAIVERMRDLEAKCARDQFHDADEEFHAAIADAAGHPGIWSLVQQTKLQIDRYRRLTLPQEGRMARVVREHAAIAAAIGAHSPERSVEAMRKHLDKLLTGLGDIQNLNPEYFVGSVKDAVPEPSRVARIASARHVTHARTSG